MQVWLEHGAGPSQLDETTSGEGSSESFVVASSGEADVSELSETAEAPSREHHGSGGEPEREVPAVGLGEKDPKEKDEYNGEESLPDIQLPVPRGAVRHYDLPGDEGQGEGGRGANS